MEIIGSGSMLLMRVFGADSVDRLDLRQASYHVVGGVIVALQGRFAHVMVLLMLLLLNLLLLN